MMKLLETDGAWLALGVSALFVVAGLALHQVIVRVLKKPPEEANRHE